MTTARAAVRATIRCPVCQLVQFESKRGGGGCRRCGYEFVAAREAAAVEVPPPLVRVLVSLEDSVAKGNWSQVYNTLVEQVAVRLKSLRKERGLSAKAIADAIGCRHTYISKIENRRLLPRLEQIYRLAKAVGVHPLNLIVSDRDLLIHDLTSDPFLQHFVGLPEDRRLEVLETARGLGAK